MSNPSLKGLNNLNRYDIAFIMSIFLFLGSLTYIEKRPSVSIVNTALAIFIFYGSASKIIGDRLKKRPAGASKALDRLYIHPVSRILMFILGVVTVYLVYIKYDINYILILAAIIFIHAFSFLLLSYYYDRKYGNT